MASRGASELAGCVQRSARPSQKLVYRRKNEIRINTDSPLVDTETKLGGNS